MKDIWIYIERLRWSAFGRIGLFWILPYNQLHHKQTKQSKRDLKLARQENQEADDFIKAYVVEAQRFAIRDLPF